MRNSFLAVCATLLFLGHSGYAAGETAPLTLQQAMGRAPAPREDVFLAVGAEKVELPKDAAAPDSDTRIPKVAAAFGYLSRDFHGVTAIAPPTMTVLNTCPGTPNPYEGMPPPEAFKLLLASLDDGQWKTLTGTTGLGVSDMTTVAQRQLFAALFPGKEVTLFPRKGGELSMGGEEESALRKLSQADALQGRLRFARRAEFDVPIAKETNGGIRFDALETRSDVYQMYNGDFGSASRDTIYGVKLRAIVPNIPKTSELEYDAPAFSVAVDLTQVATVGELVTRIGYATQQELYADRRLEKRRVTLRGPSSASAGDVLRALAFCLAGTYRKVGGAYVLTNDLLGEGTRRMILTRFVAEAKMRRAGTVSDAGDKLFQDHSLLDLKPLEDSFSVTDAQFGDLSKSPYGYYSRDIPLDKLPAGQQAMLTKFVAEWNAKHNPQSDPDDSIGPLTTSRPIRLVMSPTVLLDTPGAAAPVVLDSYLMADRLLHPSDKAREAIEAKQREEQQRADAHPRPKAPPRAWPKLSTVMDVAARRAVAVRPRTVADVDKIVADMKTLGFNEMWLDAFSDGKSRLGDDDAILKEALAKTKNAGVTVVARLDVLDWGASPPKEARDLTMLGKTSDQADVTAALESNDGRIGIPPSDAAQAPVREPVFVSPGALDVTGPLTALIKRLAATPGVTGIAMRAANSNGYDRPYRSRYQFANYTLGYTPALRLDFLRRDHMDPVDLQPDLYGESIDVDISLPEFDDWGVEVNGQGDWSDYRADLLRAFLTRLRETAQLSGRQSLPVMVKARRTLQWQADWYGSWDDPKSEPPTLTERQAYAGEDRNYVQYAHAHWRTNIFNVEPRRAVSLHALTGIISSVRPGWDGFAVDLTDQGGDPLGEAVRDQMSETAAVSTVGKDQK